ncbi:DUF2267 domain-containing protein [Candidatus Binatus soli]|jgi:uncharacterized protein (DUF2267 family)|uniref:DUF2267 domain-containing protein n=1 Tax=Candidatus Binatus soli TaxID=1953413 RepID=UPI003D09BCAD
MQDQAFFKDVMGRIGCDLRRAEGLTFAVFQELRDRITPNEALHVNAQLPKRLKMMSLEHPDRKVHRVSGDQFIWEVRRMAGLSDDAEAERAVSAVFAGLQRLLSSPTGQEGEAWDVMSQLPKDLKKLWVEAQRQHQTVNPSGV